MSALTAPQFLDRCQQQGFLLWRDGGNIRCRSPRGPVPPRLVATLARAKGALLPLLPEAPAHSARTHAREAGFRNSRNPDPLADLAREADAVYDVLEAAPAAAYREKIQAAYLAALAGDLVAPVGIPVRPGHTVTEPNTFVLCAVAELRRLREGWGSRYREVCPQADVTACALEKVADWWADRQSPQEGGRAGDA